MGKVRLSFVDKKRRNVSCLFVCSHIHSILEYIYIFSLFLLDISNKSGTNPGIRIVALVPVDAVKRG